ncbi:MULTISPECIES: NUDIX hydrolase [Metallibacterium]|uniref:NUDIX hydrolase n=1 Tax=Metallibacterium TaxID=1218803 RepID=UPI0026029EC8|nr:MULTISPECIES: NUDIX hydrolase [Metallibacterium]MBW8076365.1 NUDIX domain-containing protein [Metallibacterium scheffleri]
MPHDETEQVWRPRVTVAAVVARGERFLMVEEEIRGALCLNQPAGHLEAGENLVDAMLRETLEETGWQVRPLHFVGVMPWINPRHGDTTLRFTFAAEPIRRDHRRPLDAGIVRVLWLSRSEIAAQSQRLRTPLVLASIDAWLAGQRLPLDAIGRLHDAQPS